MIKEGKFGVHEMAASLVIALTNKLFFSTPSRFFDTAGTSAWLTITISCLSAIILFIFVYLLLKRFPGKNIVEIYDITLGRAIGLIFSLILAIGLFIYSAILVREFADMARTYIFVSTDPSQLCAALLVPVILGAYLGLESISRFAKFAIYFALTSLLLLIFMVSPFFNVTNLFPILGKGIGVNVEAGLRWTGIFSEVAFIAVFAGSMQGAKYIKKAGFYSLIISGLTITVSLVVAVLVLTYTLGREQLSVMYMLSKQIEIGSFFQRLDPIFSYLWFVTTIITICITFYCGISVFCKSFRIQDHRPLILPAAIIVYSASFMPKDFTDVEFFMYAIRTNSTFITFGMPLVACIVSLLRGKKGNAS